MTESADRARKLQRVLVIEAGANTAAAAAKLGVGLASGSAALVGDAVHSLTDLANNAVALVANRMAHAPPDREHPYGHRKIESLAVFTLAVGLVVLAVHVAWSAGSHPAPVVSSGWQLAIVAALPLAQVGVSLWEARWARRLASDLLLADSRHTLSDVLVLLAVLAGWQLAARGHLWADTLAAWAVSGVVLVLAWDLFRRAIPTLVDRSWLDPDALQRAVADVHGVDAVRRVRSLGRGEATRVDVVVTADPQLSLREAHSVADTIETVLAEQFGAHDVSVHVEPNA